MSLFRRGIRSLREYGLRQTADTVVRLAVESLRERYYTYDGFEYSIRDAVLWPYGIDVWVRNGITIDELTKIGVDRSTTILDVGAGGEGIMKIGKYSDINLDGKNITQIDIDPEAFDTDRDSAGIVGDGCSMPFKNNSFDIAISIDSLEHVPEERRDAYIQEMMRVAREHVLLHFPLNSSDGQFVGRESDQKYQNWHTKRFDTPEPNTAEHLSTEHPEYEQLTQYFDETEIRGVQNSSVWLTYMKLSKIHLIRFLSGMYYYLLGKHKDNQPPYHGCFIHHKIKNDDTVQLDTNKVDS